MGLLLNTATLSSQDISSEFTVYAASRIGAAPAAEAMVKVDLTGLPNNTTVTLRAKSDAKAFGTQALVADASGNLAATAKLPLLDGAYELTVQAAGATGVSGSISVVDHNRPAAARAVRDLTPTVSRTTKLQIQANGSLKGKTDIKIGKDQTTPVWINGADYFGDDEWFTEFITPPSSQNVSHAVASADPAEFDVLGKPRGPISEVNFPGAVFYVRGVAEGSQTFVEFKLRTNSGAELPVFVRVIVTEDPTL